MYKHKYDVKTFLTWKNSVSKQYNIKGITYSDMNFTVVEWINQDPECSKEIGLKRENLWIWSLDPYIPLS